MLEQLKEEVERFGVGIPQRIPVQGTYNLRDVASYRTAAGEPLRRGVFYRADNLGRLSEGGREALISLGVGTVVDLRTGAEIREYPNLLRDDPRVEFHVLDLVGDSHEIISRGDTIVTGDPEERRPDGTFMDPVGRLVLIYSTILDHQRDTVRRILEVLAGDSDAADAPAGIFHCVAGQDRTGLVAALLLSIAGVDERSIVFDYAATAYYNYRRYRQENGRRWWGMTLETPEEYGAQFCPAGAMTGTLHWLRDRFGGAEEYLRAIGVSERVCSRIRHRFLSV